MASSMDWACSEVHRMFPFSSESCILGFHGGHHFLSLRSTQKRIYKCRGLKCQRKNILFQKIWLKTFHFQDGATTLKKKKMKAYFNIKPHCASKNCIRYFYIFSKFLSFFLTTKTILGNQHKFEKWLN